MRKSTELVTFGSIHQRRHVRYFMAVRLLWLAPVCWSIVTTHLHGCEEPGSETLGVPSVSENLQLLANKLSSPNGEERLEAEAGIRRLGRQAVGALPTIQECLRHPNAEVRRSAVVAMAALQDPAAVTPLLDALNDSDSLVACMAASMITELRDTNVVPVLTAILHDPSRSVEMRADAAWGLSRLTDHRESIDAVMAVAKSSSSQVDIRSRAMRGMGRFGCRSAQATIVAILVDRANNPQVRIAAAAALADLEGDAAEPVLLQVAGNRADHVLVRLWAAMDAVVISGGRVAASEFVDALNVPRTALPRLDPLGLGDDDVSFARRAALHLLIDHGQTFAVRSSARKLLRSLVEYDRAQVPLALAVLCAFVPALIGSVIFLREHRSGRLSVRPVIWLVAASFLVLIVPILFDATVPLQFDDPGWYRTSKSSIEPIVGNPNLPYRATWPWKVHEGK